MIITNGHKIFDSNSSETSRKLFSYYLVSRMTDLVIENFSDSSDFSETNLEDNDLSIIPEDQEKQFNIDHYENHFKMDYNNFIEIIFNISGDNLNVEEIFNATYSAFEDNSVIFKHDSKLPDFFITSIYVSKESSTKIFFPPFTNNYKLREGSNLLHVCVNFTKFKKISLDNFYRIPRRIFYIGNLIKSEIEETSDNVEVSAINAKIETHYSDNDNPTGIFKLGIISLCELLYKDSFLSFNVKKLIPHIVSNE